MSFQIDLRGKVVLITGVSSGIGLGVARQFARAGAKVAGCARKTLDAPCVKEFMDTVRTEGGEPLYVQTDVSVADELATLVEQVIRTFGRLDILVSNAGQNVFEGAAGCNEQQWQYNLDLNLASHWRTIRKTKGKCRKERSVSAKNRRAAKTKRIMETKKKASEDRIKSDAFCV